MALHRRDRLTELGAGLFAFFWIVLGGVSGVYLFTAFANPTALGGQLVQSDCRSVRATLTSAVERLGRARPGACRDQGAACAS